MNSPSQEPSERDNAAGSPEPLHPVAPGQLGPADTGLPGLRSWGAVYAVVAGVFVLWLTLLLVFMRSYS